MITNPEVDISLICANFNNGAYLDEFINSILTSSFIPKQIIIVDDGSTDESRQILQHYSEIKPFDIIFLNENHGFANALNIALNKVSSTYTARADPDDILHPERFEKQLKFLTENPNISGIGCNVEYFLTGKKEILHVSNFPENPDTIKKLYHKGEHGIQHPTLMIRSDIIKKFRYCQEAVPAEDYLLIAQMIKEGYTFANLRKPLYKMRIHPQSISSRLQYSTIRKTFAYRDKLFETKTHEFRKRTYYIHIKNYRNYMLSQSPILKYYHLLMSVLFYPGKAIKRILK